MGNQCFIEFISEDIDKVNRINKLFSYIALLKNENVQIEDLEYYIYDRINDFYLENELNYFWWPTEEESKIFWEQYNVLPEDKRIVHLKSVPWDFETVFNEIGVGEYTIGKCTIAVNNTYKLYFDPIAWPYGGNEVIQEALKAFGVTIIKIYD